MTDLESRRLRPRQARARRYRRTAGRHDDHRAARARRARSAHFKHAKFGLLLSPCHSLAHGVSSYWHESDVGIRVMMARVFKFPRRQHYVTRTVTRIAGGPAAVTVQVA